MIASYIEYLKSHKWFALAGLVGLICVYAFIQEIIPQMIEISDMKKSIRQNEARVAQVEEWDWTIQRMEKKKEKLHQQIENLVFSQQQKNQFSSIYAFLSENANRQNITLLNIKLGDSEEGNRHIRLPFALKIEAKYHALAKYLNTLETSEPIIQIESWSIETKDMTKNDLTATLLIYVYFLT